MDMRNLRFPLRVPLFQAVNDRIKIRIKSFNKETQSQSDIFRPVAIPPGIKNKK